MNLIHCTILYKKGANMQVQQIPISQAREKISEVVNKAANGQTFEITKGDVPMALIIGKEQIDDIIKKSKGYVARGKLVEETKKLRAKSKRLTVSTAVMLQEARNIREQLYKNA